MVLQHELGLFLEDIQKRISHQNDALSTLLFDKLLDRICADPLHQPAMEMFDLLIERTGCILSTAEARLLLNDLRGQHVHIWQEGGRYNILVVSKDKQVARALKDLSALVSDCSVHDHTHETSELIDDKEGYLLVADGEKAFLLARLFLRLDAGQDQ